MTRKQTNDHQEVQKKKNEPLTYIMYAILAVSVVLLIYSALSILSIKQTAKQTSETGSRYVTVSTGSTNSDDVAIELTPQGTSQGVLTVQISANTHSVDLSQFDLTKITYLEADGKKIAPISAPPLQGHHNNGVLRFQTDAKTFSITITGIPNIEERKYTWP